MNSVSTIAASGMQAAQQRLQATGHNLANLQTAGFRRQTVETQTSPAGGVTTSVRTADQPGEDIATDLVGLMTAKHEFVANLQVFKTEDRMLGSLLDSKA